MGLTLGIPQDELGDGSVGSAGLGKIGSSFGMRTGESEGFVDGESVIRKNPLSWYNYHTMTRIKNKTTQDIFDKLFMVAAISLVVILMISVATAIFDKQYAGRVYPNISVGGVSFGGKTKTFVIDYWEAKNVPLKNISLELQYENKIATISSEDLRLGYDATLSATQAYVVGRSRLATSNFLNKFIKKNIDLSPYFHWDTDHIDEALNSIATQIDVPAEEPLFQFKDGKVVSFRVSKNGKKLDKTEARIQIRSALLTLMHEYSPMVRVPLKIQTVEPTTTTGKVNTYGVQERIGRGYSEFSGSIPGRIHNVALAASRLNGILIKPGETFSFNDAVGDISAATGYQSAYIIKDGRTVLGDGGGVCQVSSTLFRAALNAGLPIVERHAHAYRVHYYEEGGFKPGLDATVFGPTYDLKFKNNTSGYILIQTSSNMRVPSLTLELYGTSDGRISEIKNQKLWDIAAPPPPLYQDDPTLPKDTVKQVDFEAWGAKASFDYLVTKNGEILENDTFISNYRPWQAIYLKGTL